MFSFLSSDRILCGYNTPRWHRMQFDCLLLLGNPFFVLDWLLKIMNHAGFNLHWFIRFCFCFYSDDDKMAWKSGTRNNFYKFFSFCLSLSITVKWNTPKKLCYEIPMLFSMKTTTFTFYDRLFRLASTNKIKTISQLCTSAKQQRCNSISSRTACVCVNVRALTTV